jgi:hypothetical protein
MLNLDENLKKVIILIVDGIGNRIVLRSDVKGRNAGYDELRLKDEVEGYLYLLMKVKNLIALDLMKEVE